MRLPRFELGFSLLVALLCAPSSLVGVPGLESAVVFGVLLPPVFAAAAARRAALERSQGKSDAALATLRALLVPTIAMLLVLAVQLARHLVDPACATASGLPQLLLGPYPGMVLAALVGELVGRVVERPRRAAGLALALVVASYGVVVYEIVATPAVFVFSIFGGHWPGPIYDDLVTFPATLATYRAVTSMAIVALALLARFGARRDEPAFLRRAGLALGAVCALAFVVCTVLGSALGHRTDVAHIDAALGAVVRGERCVLHLPSEVPAYERRRTLAECEAHVRGVERTLGLRRRQPLHAFFYRSAAEKRALVGAAETYVAKPWRGEVHVQREGFPHQVLRHEIVHVIAAEVGPWPFRTAGRLGGLWMNPGLVEGLAVAAADEGRDGLTADQWSRAMLDLGQLPSVDALTGTGFLGQGVNASYQAAGSFVAHLLRTRGSVAVGRMYRRGTVGDAATRTRLERSWHEHLRTVELPAAALELARFRLLDRGLFSTRCARLRERVGHELAEARERGADGRALRACRRLLAIDPEDASARIAEVQTLARAGRLSEAESALARLDSSRIAPRLLLARAHQTLGDALVVRAAFEDEAALARARVHFETSLAVPQDEATLRALEVRILALRAMPEARRVVLGAIVERGKEALPEAAAVAGLLALDDPALRATARYLAARRLLAGPQQPRTRALLDEALGLGLPSDRMHREAARLLALEATRGFFENSARAESRDEAQARWNALLSDPLAASEARRMLTMIAGLGD